MKVLCWVIVVGYCKVMKSNEWQEHFLPLPIMYTKDTMPVNRNHIPTTEDISKWPRLSDIELPVVDSHIGLLPGNNAKFPLDLKVRLISQNPY